MPGSVRFNNEWGEIMAGWERVNGVWVELDFGLDAAVSDLALQQFVVYANKGNFFYRIDPSDPNNEYEEFGVAFRAPEGFTDTTKVRIAGHEDSIYAVSYEENSAGLKLWQLNPNNPSVISSGYGVRGNMPFTDVEGIASNGTDLYAIQSGASLNNKALWLIDDNIPDSESGIYGKIGAFPITSTSDYPISMDFAQNSDLYLMVNNSSGESSIYLINSENPSDVSGDYGYLGRVRRTSTSYAKLIGLIVHQHLLYGLSTAPHTLHLINPENTEDLSGDFGIIDTIPTWGVSPEITDMAIIL